MMYAARAFEPKVRSTPSRNEPISQATMKSASTASEKPAPKSV